MTDAIRSERRHPRGRSAARRVADLDLPDVNVLVALLHPGHVHHSAANAWLDGTDRFATTPITESGVLRMALNPAVAGTTVSGAAALTSLTSLRHHPKAGFLPDDSTLADAQIDLSGLIGFRQVTDLHLVNLAARHDACLVTFDRRLGSTLVDSDQALIRVLG